MLAPCGLNLHLNIVFRGPCVKKIIKVIKKTNKKLDIFFIHTYSHLTQEQNTFHEKAIYPNCDKRKYKSCQNFKLKK
jgi:hypothetical protein